MTKQSKVFNDNADQYAAVIDKIQSKVDKEVIAFITTLDKNGNKIKNNPENMRKVIQFQGKLEQIIKNVGFTELIKNYISDVPELIKEIK